MRQLLIRVKEFEETTSLNKNQPTELPKEYLYRALLIEETAVLTDDGGGGTPAYGEDKEHRMSERVRVITEEDDIINCSGRTLGKCVIEPMFGVAQDQVIATTPASGAAHTLKTTRVLPFGDERATNVAWAGTLIRSWARTTFRMEQTTPSAVANLMANAGAGAVTLTSLKYDVYALVYEVTAEEKALLDATLVEHLKIHDDFESTASATAHAHAKFNKSNLPSGNRVVRMSLMVTDGEARDALELDYISLKNGGSHLVPERAPVSMLKSMDTTFNGYDASDGVYHIDLDMERSHISGPLTNGLQDFALWWISNAGTGVVTLWVTTIERAKAKYKFTGQAPEGVFVKATW